MLECKIKIMNELVSTIINYKKKGMSLAESEYDVHTLAGDIRLLECISIPVIDFCKRFYQINMPDPSYKSYEKCVIDKYNVSSYPLQDIYKLIEEHNSLLFYPVKFVNSGGELEYRLCESITYREDDEDTPLPLKKYTMVKEDPNGNLYRIKALRDFSDVKKGEFGGYIENSKNLSHEGDCWVYNSAIVKNHTRVSENAKIRDNVIVSGHALVSGNASVSGAATISGHSVIKDNAIISDNVHVVDNGHVYGNSLIRGDVHVSGNAHIYDDAFVTDKCQIRGSSHVHGHTIVTGTIILDENADISVDNKLYSGDFIKITGSLVVEQK